MDTVVYIASVAPLKANAEYEKAYLSVTDIRREKADRMRRKEDKCLSLGAGIMLKYALGRAGIRDNETVTGENGKPYLASREAFFNLSHSGEYVMCAVSDDEIGCDIEKISKGNENTARRFFSAEEYDFITHGADENERAVRFMRIWTLKESYIKATGKGLKTSLDSFTVAFENDVPKLCGAEDEYAFSEFGEIGGYRCAVCRKGNKTEIKFVMTDILKILNGVE